MLNSLAINPIGVYQQLLQQAAHDIPSLLPRIQQTAASAAIHHIDEQPVAQDPRKQLDLHTQVDYEQWLKHLYQYWCNQLITTFGKHPHPQPSDDMHWHPESTATLLNDMALSYAGWLWHQSQIPLPDSIERITLLWRDTWHGFTDELQQTHANSGVMDALNATASRFHQFWLASCLHLAELQPVLPSQNSQSQEQK